MDSRKTVIGSVGIICACFLLITWTLLLCLPGHALAEEKKILKLGSVEPMSGGAAAWGEAMNEGVILAADEFNANGGVKVGNSKYHIRVLTEDDKYTGTGGASAASKLVYEEGVRFIVGSLSSAATLAMQPITEKQKCIVLTNAFADVLGKNKPYTFRIAPNVLQGVAGCFIAAKKKYPGKIKRIACVDANDATGWAAAKAAKVAAKALGWKVVTEEYFERGISDFHPLLARVLAKKPDLIESSGCSSKESALIAAQSYELGYRGKLTGMVIMPEMMAKLGGQGIEGMIGWFGVDYDMPWINSSQKELYRKFKARWPKKKMLYQVELSYGATKGLLMAIEKAGTIDTTKVVDVFQNMKWDHPAGGKAEWLDYDSYGYKGIKRQIGISHPITELRGGKLHLLMVADLAKILPEVGIKIEHK